MIYKGISDLSPKVTISVDNVPVDYASIARLTIEMSENMHNVAILEFSGINPRLITEYIERPVQLKIEMRDREPVSFCGYITHIEPLAVTHAGTVNNSPFQLSRVYCLGASYIMKSKSSRAWTNVTLSEVAEQVADKYQFSVSVPNNTFRFSSLVQSGQSDWSFLVETALKLGYRVTAENTHINIWDPYKAVSRKRSYNVLYTARGTNSDPSPQPGQIIKFEGRIGAVTPDGNKTPSTIHVLDKTGKIMSVSNADNADQSGLGTPITSIFTDTYNVNADSFDMGNTLVTGDLRKDFPLTATVDVVGDPTVQPGGIVNIREYNTEFDGFWHVSSVRHEIAQSAMMSYLVLNRDSLGPAQDTSTPTEVYKTPPAPSLRSARWVSETEYVSVYV